MRAIRSLTSLIACAVLVLVLGASSADAANKYTFVGKWTTGRGAALNIPMAGNTGCGSLTTISQIMSPGGLMQYPVERGVNTQALVMVTMNFDWMNPAHATDLGCVKHLPNKIITTTGKGVGGAFTVPPKVFSQPYPDDLYPLHYKYKNDLPARSIMYLPPALQLATSHGITGPMQVRSRYEGTKSNMYAPAVFRRFKTGAWATQTGRTAAPGSGAKFTWCPPPATNPGAGGGFCTNINQAGFPAIVKYNGTANSFGGTMALVTKAKAGTGNLAIGIGAGAVAFNLLPKGISLATGRGFAQYNTGVLPSGEIWGNHMVAKKYVGPRLKSQNIITMVTALQPTMWPKGVAYTWGFPWTTRTVVVRNTGVMTATVTGKGWDCPGGMQGPGCGVATGMGTMTLGMVPGAVARNISLVAGGVGFAALPPPFGNVPTLQFGSMQMLLPEPGPTSQQLAGLIAVLGIAAWRWRRAR